MKKKKTLWIIIIIILAVLIGAYFYITGSSERTAFLKIESGEVQVDTGKGWMSAIDDMDLNLNDKVKTLQGEALIILYESILVSVEPNSIVSIAELSKDNVNINQESGSTWNKFIGLMGIDGFSVTTPTTVATVRGTEFGAEMNGLKVGEGNIIAEANGKTFEVEGGKKLVMENGELVKKDLTREEKEIIIAKMKKNIARMKMIRQMQIEKKPFLYKRFKSAYSVTDQEVLEQLEKADIGKYDLNEIEERTPVKIKTIGRIKIITEEIREQNRYIAELEQ